MIIETRDSSGIPVVGLKGSFESPRDLDEFSAELERWTQAGRVRVILDLHLLAYLNSNAVGRIIKYKKSLQSAGGDLALIQPTRAVREVFELLQLQSVLRPLATEAEAHALLSGGAGLAPSVPLPGNSANSAQCGIDLLLEFTDEPTRERLGPFEATGELLAIDLAGAIVRWHPAPTHVDVTGARVLLKLRLPQYRRPTYIEARAGVTRSEPMTDMADAVRLETRFAGGTSDEKKDLERYVSELAASGIRIGPMP